MIYVVIAVFNRKEYTRKCIQLLKEQTYKNIVIIIVDDGSTDGTSEMIINEFSDIILIKGIGTWYWTGSMYHGVEKAKELSRFSDDFVLVLNDDLIFNDSFINDMINSANKYPKAILQAVELCINEREYIWQGGAQVNYWTAKHKLINYQRKFSDFPSDYVVKSSYLTGRGILIPIKVFGLIDNFDIRYQQSGDPEFSRRALKFGWELLVVYGVQVYSYEKGKNFNETNIYRLREIKKYFFSVLSMARLRTRWMDAMSFTNNKFQGVIYFIFDFIRLLGHFIIRVKSI